MRRPPVARPARLLTALVVVAAAAGLAAPSAGAETAGAAAQCAPAGGVGVPDAAAPAGAEVVVAGHGWGHGMGMSQYGAQGAALLGCSSDTILRTYYPGLVPARKTLSGRVLVRLLDDGGDRGRAEVLAEGGPITWRSGTRSAVQPQGSTWSVRRDGTGVAVQAGTSTTAARVPALSTTAGAVLSAEHEDVVTRVATWSASGAASLVRRSDGDRTRFTGSSRGLAVREVMEDDARGSAVSKYLRGLAEMPVSWPVAAQEAQVVAARTYLAGRWSSAEGGYLVVPTTVNQVWQGYDQEQQDARYGGKLAEAVRRTSSGTTGTVMTTSSGAVARDVLYASSHGGWSESNRYVWGSSPVAHLSPVDDSRWDLASSNPNRSWTVGLSRAALARAFGLASVSDVRLAPRGSSARTAVVVEGVRSGADVQLALTGQQARDRLAAVAPGVRSSGFAITLVAPSAPAVAPPAPASRIASRWAALGGAAGALGRATTPERPTPAPVAGRYQHFERGSLYDSPSTGPQVVKGAVRDRWAAMGWERSALRFPTTDERVAPDRVGRYNHFQGGSVYWTPRTGAQAVQGLIRARWAAMGWETSVLGYPTTSERRTPDRLGRYTHFQGGSVYWTPATGAHEVLGATRDRWASMGWERSALGYPTSRAVPTATGTTTFFQGGAIRWASATGATTVELT